MTPPILPGDFNRRDEAVEGVSATLRRKSMGSNLKELIDRGCAYLDQGKLDEAEKFFDKALNLAPPPSLKNTKNFS